MTKQYKQDSWPRDRSDQNDAYSGNTTVEDGAKLGLRPGTGVPEAGEAEEAADTERVGNGNPNKHVLPPDVAVWNEARRLVADKNTRVEDLAVCTSQDPTIVMELLKVANAMYFSGGRQTISSAKAAIMRLGSDVLLETLDQLSERKAIENEDVSHWFEIHRSRCNRASIVARMISEGSAKTLADDVQSAALLMYVGEMLAVLHFNETYVKLAEELSRSSINYRLAQDYKYDVEIAGITYLRRFGIPESLLSAIDRESSSKSKDRAIMKPICFAAGELVDAFDMNRWEKFAPGKTLPSKSSIRILQLTDQQYLKLYERAGEFLFNYRLMQEKARTDATQSASSEDSPTSSEQAETPVTDELADEINSILFSLGAPSEDSVQEVEAPVFESDPAPKQVAPPAAKTTIRSVNAVMSDPSDRFSLQKSTERTHVVRDRTPPPPTQEPPKLVSQRGTAVVSNINDMFNSAETSEQLLGELLSMLVDKGPFQKSALIVVAGDRKEAIVVAARGPNIGNGQRLSITDPLNPLAMCFSKVQSFGNRTSPVSPFGSKSYAISPINADHDTTVALYADCGNDKSISFEARRVFRTVVEILNQRLPQIPGGIPVELA